MKTKYWLFEKKVGNYSVRALFRLPQILFNTPRPVAGIWHPDVPDLYDYGIDMPTELKLTKSECLRSVRIVILGFGGFVAVHWGEMK